ncbi:MAG: hypothetical protein KIH62_002100 [Candidatus Kerfeldbacteria bacterium]|nr:hypothetical protein [Candidatus Kerfeldbacteria bacterium]
MNSVHTPPNNEQDDTEAFSLKELHTIDLLSAANPEAHIPSKAFIKRTRATARSIRQPGYAEKKFRISLVSILGVGAAFCAWGVVGVFTMNTDNNSTQTVASENTNAHTQTQVHETVNSETSTHANVSVNTNTPLVAQTNTSPESQTTNTNTETSTTAIVALQADIDDLNSLIASIDSSIDEISTLNEDSAALDSSASANNSIETLSNELGSL